MKNNIVFLCFTLMVSLNLSAQDFRCGDKIKDYDGNEYTTVQIGDQCWLKENLRTTHDANGKEIAMGSEGNFSIPYRYAPNGNLSNVEKYGCLYNYVAAVAICPEGWRLPTKYEFDDLKSISGSHHEAGTHAAFINKSQNDYEDWKISNEQNDLGNNLSAENTRMFSALPAGALLAEKSVRYSYFGDSALFWSTTTNGSNGAYAFSINMMSKQVQMVSHYRTSAFSVRCVKSEK